MYFDLILNISAFFLDILTFTTKLYFNLILLISTLTLKFPLSSRLPQNDVFHLKWSLHSSVVVSYITESG